MQPNLRKKEHNKNKHVSPAFCAVCNLSQAVMSMVYGIAPEHMMAATRQSARIAFARQAAMYLAHTAYGLSYLAIGKHFRRDRTTVNHACALVEGWRDKDNIDMALSCLEIGCRFHSHYTSLQAGGVVQPASVLFILSNWRHIS